MRRWLVSLVITGLLVLFGLGCGEPKKDPTLKDKDKPKPAEKTE
jgi:hypothetical protein